ncbi:MAG: hypothetical protein IJB59_14455 [Oscillospiraceae bacterium]|nr:hypothetical protein [Oscillospiraceae bacterium]
MQTTERSTVMRLWAYDLFIWINFMAILVVFWNKRMHRELDWLIWVLIFCFGGIGSWIGLFFAYLRKRETQRTVAFLAGIIQVLLLQNLIEEFLFMNF